MNKLNEMKEPDQRMLQLIGFILSGYSGLSGRSRKPFNPIVGETFDFIHGDGWRYHAEQVGFLSVALITFRFRLVITLQLVLDTPIVRTNGNGFKRFKQGLLRQ